MVKNIFIIKIINEANYQFLIKKRENVVTEHSNDSKVFIEYSNDMEDIYKNIEDYNPNKKYKILIVFDDMIVDIFSNKNLNTIVTGLFIRGRNLNDSLFLSHNLILRFQKILG